MGLTKEQIDQRKGRLTASRVACLMTGDKEKIMQLYLEMTNQAEPENLDHIWPVRLGEATESLSLEWYERKSGCVLSRRGEVISHSTHNWAAATLDGWDPILGCPCECKHCGGREPLEVLIDRYQPQCQWQMFVSGAQQCALSVIMGANEPIVEYIDRDDAYIAEMVKRGEQFMLCVALRRPPVDLEPVPPPADATKIIDMAGNNYWAADAADWLETQDAAVKNKDREKALKAMVPVDAKKCFGYGVRITRDRAGRLSLRRDE
jgi:predicted phage-related endonuclease